MNYEVALKVFSISFSEQKLGVVELWNSFNEQININHLYVKRLSHWHSTMTKTTINMHHFGCGIIRIGYNDQWITVLRNSMISFL